MNPIKLTLLGAAMALTASTALAQPAPTPTHKPSMMARMMAAKKSMHPKSAVAPANHSMMSHPMMSHPMAAGPAKSGTASSMGPGQHSAISVACSQKADAQGLHGKAREAFRSKCKRGG